MEKLMIFGLAMFLSLMISNPTKPYQIHPKPVPVSGVNETPGATSIEPGATNDNSRPVKIYPKAEYWHDPA